MQQYSGLYKDLILYHRYKHVATACLTAFLSLCGKTAKKAGAVNSSMYSKRIRYGIEW